MEQVSCARTCKVSPGRFIPLCHHDPKYTKVSNNMIINAHIHMCSNRTKHLRIDTALIPLKGSLHRKQKISYGLQHAKIISRRLLVTVSEGLTLEDRKRDNVPANKRGWCRVYTPDLKVAKISATNGQRIRDRSHVRSDDDLRPLLQLGSGSSGSSGTPAALRHGGDGGGEDLE